jgi:AraC-like DNA-binding protein
MLLISIPLQYLHVIGTFQGVLLAVMLMLGNGVNNAGRLLGAWCFFMAFYFSSPLVIIHSDNTFFANLIGWGYYIPASFGAFLYLYCRTAIIDKPFHFRDVLHITPLFLCFILNQDYLLASSLDKIDIVNNALRGRGTVLITQLVMMLQAFFYLGLSVKLIMTLKKQADDSLSGFNPNIFTWFWGLLSMYGAIWLIEAIGMIMGGNYMLVIVSDLLFILLIYGVSLAQWREPKLFTIGKLSSIITNKNETKYKVGLFDSDTRRSLLDTVLEFMKEKEPFLDNGLTLDSLANSVGLSSHHLSEILNKEAKKNFYQFINEYRINFICELIVDKPDINILDLAMSAGFSSKSTFNVVFKKIKCMTPSQYRKHSTHHIQ